MAFLLRLCRYAGRLYEVAPPLARFLTLSADIRLSPSSVSSGTEDAMPRKRESIDDLIGAYWSVATSLSGRAACARAMFPRR